MRKIHKPTIFRKEILNIVYKNNSMSKIKWPVYAFKYAQICSNNLFYHRHWRLIKNRKSTGFGDDLKLLTISNLIKIFDEFHYKK